MLQDRIRVSGRVYKLTVLRVETLDEQGRPAQVTVITDERTVEISGGEWFLAAYLPERSLRPGAYKPEWSKEGPGAPTPEIP